MKYEQVCPLFSETHDCRGLDDSECSTYYPLNYEKEDAILHNYQTQHNFYIRDFIESNENTRAAMSIIVDGIWGNDDVGNYEEYKKYTDLILSTRNIELCDIWFNLLIEKFDIKYVVCLLLHPDVYNKNYDYYLTYFLSRQDVVKDDLENNWKIMMPQLITLFDQNFDKFENKEIIYHYILSGYNRQKNRIIEKYINYIKRNTDQETLRRITAIHCCDKIDMIPELMCNIIEKL